MDPAADAKTNKLLPVWLLVKAWDGSSANRAG